MAKSLQKYANYTTKELETYVYREGSCVLKINTSLHFSLAPYCLANFKSSLLAHIVRRKVGYFDAELDGIVLAVKNIKVLGPLGAVRADDPRIHVNIKADCYVFRPVAGAVLTGVVKHIGNHHVGVIIYRVFNANIRVKEKLEKDALQLEQTLKFRIKNYDLQNVFPYIEGELLKQRRKGEKESIGKALETEITDNMNESDNEEIVPQKIKAKIKEEPISEPESVSSRKNLKNAEKIRRKRKRSEVGDEFPVIKVKKEKPKEKRFVEPIERIDDGTDEEVEEFIPKPIVKVEAASSSESNSEFESSKSTLQHTKSKHKLTM